MLKRIIPTILAVILTLSLFACGSNAPSSGDNSIVGKWAETDSMYSEFTEDGKYTYYLSGEVFVEGTYTAENGNLTLNYTTDGSSEKATYTIKGDKLTINYKSYSVTATRMD